MAKTLKVSDDTYERLNQLAGSIRAKEGRPASLDAAIGRLLEDREEASILDYAGAWDLTEDEAREMRETLDLAWSTWRIGS